MKRTHEESAPPEADGPRPVRDMVRTSPAASSTVHVETKVCRDPSAPRRNVENPLGMTRRTCMRRVRGCGSWAFPNTPPRSRPSLSTGMSCWSWSNLKTTSRRAKPGIHSVDPESGSTLRLLQEFPFKLLGQLASFGSTLFNYTKFSFDQMKKPKQIEF